jgi:hypothetical protein
MPDFSGIPECEYTFEECPYDCWQALTANTVACAQCITASIDWSGNSCGQTECDCPGAAFAYCPDVCGPP